MSVTNYVDLLGHRVTDKVTSFEGTVTSVSFDLYGCVQCIVQPDAEKGKTDMKDSRWFDAKRLTVRGKARAMPVPHFGDIEQGKEIGPTQKPPQSNRA